MSTWFVVFRLLVDIVLALGAIVITCHAEALQQLLLYKSVLDADPGRFLTWCQPSAVIPDVCAEDLAARTKVVVKQLIRKLPRDLDRRLPGERALEFPGEHRVITQQNDLGLQLHWKCGHAPISVIRRLIEHNAIEGFERLKPSDVVELVEGCSVCQPLWQI